MSILDQSGYIFNAIASSLACTKLWGINIYSICTRINSSLTNLKVAGWS
jgi:hypothetical protein